MKPDLGKVGTLDTGQAAPPSVNRARPTRTGEHGFYLLMSLAMVGTVLLGFRATYFPLGPKPSALSSPVIVLHGVVFSVFLGLFVLQAALVSKRRTNLHMKLGLWLYGLAAVMLPLVLLAAADQIKRDLAKGPAVNANFDPFTFSFVSVMGMVMFGSLIGTSYLFRRQPQIHKRLVLFATLSLMDAGIDRWPWASWGIRHGHDWSTWVYTALLLAPVVYDLVSTRQVHAATMLAAPYVWILERLELPIGKTAEWHVVAGWMLRHLTR